MLGKMRIGRTILDAFLNPKAGIAIILSVKECYYSRGLDREEKKSCGMKQNMLYSTLLRRL